MTDPKILRVELCGHWELSEVLCVEICENGRCEIFSWENYYDFEEIGEGIICEECLDEWVGRYLVRRL